MTSPRFWTIVVLALVLIGGALITANRYLSIQQKNQEILEKVADNQRFVDSSKLEFQKMQIAKDTLKSEKQQEKQNRTKFETNYHKKDIEYKNTNFDTDTTELYKFLGHFKPE